MNFTRTPCITNLPPILTPYAGLNGEGRALPITFAADACSKETCCYLFPVANEESFFRISLVHALRQQLKGFRVCWWVCAEDLSLMNCCMMDLCDALDSNRLVSADDRFIEIIRLHTELQREWGTSSVFLLDGATTTTAVEFLSRCARWGAHVLIIPSRPIDTDDIRPFVSQLIQPLADSSSGLTKEEGEGLSAILTKQLGDGADRSWVMRCCSDCGHDPRFSHAVVRQIVWSRLSSFDFWKQFDSLTREYSNVAKKAVLVRLLSRVLSFSDCELCWAIVFLPLMFPTFVVGGAIAEKLVQLGLGTFTDSRCDHLLIDPAVRGSVEAVLTEKEREGVVRALLRRIGQRGEIDQDTVDNGAHQFLWDRWRSAIVAHVVAQVRKRHMYFPSIASLFEPRPLKSLDCVVLPVLLAAPASSRNSSAIALKDARHSSWDRSALQTMERYVQKVQDDGRFNEAVELREQQVVVYLNAIVGEEHPSDFLLVAIQVNYRLIAKLYTKAGLGGVAQDYVSRAESICRVVLGSRRDTPGRAVALFQAGVLLLELSNVEEQRAAAVRKSSLLEADLSDMQLRAAVKADVDKENYSREAGNTFEEVVSVFRDTSMSLVGDDVAICHASLSRAFLHEHRDKEALAHAEAALDALARCRRSQQSGPLGAPKPVSGVAIRDELQWVRSNISRFLTEIAEGRYSAAQVMLDQSVFLAFCGYVPASPDTILFGAAESHVQALTTHLFPTPLHYDHLQLLTSFTDKQVAKHHGKDWEGKSLQYLFPAHVFLLTVDSTHDDAPAMFDRLLACGVNPNTCSPSDMKTLLHIAVERDLGFAISLLLRHPLVSVDYVSPFVLTAKRHGLSTIARIEQAPCLLESPFLSTRGNPNLVMQLLLDGASPAATFQKNLVFIVEELSLEDDGVVHTIQPGVPVRSETKLGALFSSRSPFHSSVADVLLNCAISSESRERVAWYCSQPVAERIIVEVVDPEVVEVLGHIIQNSNNALEAAQKLVASAAEFIHRNRVFCARRLIENCGINLEMLFWEDVVAYNKAIFEQREKDRSQSVVALALPQR